MKLMYYYNILLSNFFVSYKFNPKITKQTENSFNQKTE